jgi:hypothetical protein
VLIWHLLTKDEPYLSARPAFVAMKMRKLELKTEAKRAHGKDCAGRDYWIKEIRHREMELVAQAKPPTQTWSRPGDPIPKNSKPSWRQEDGC